LFAIQHATAQQQRFQERPQRMGENTRQRCLLALLMTFLRPGVA
jgi:hypothetical protein